MRVSWLHNVKPFTGRGRADDLQARIDAPPPRSIAAAGYLAAAAARLHDYVVNLE
jgi:hypothetical protein